MKKSKRHKKSKRSRRRRSSSTTDRSRSGTPYRSRSRTPYRSRSRTPDSSRRETPCSSRSRTPRANDGTASKHSRKGDATRSLSPPRRRTYRSRSRSGTRDPSRRGHRDWADIPAHPDYDEIIDFDDPLDREVQPSGTIVAEVTAETEALLKNNCLSRAKNNDRLKVRNSYTLPKVEATKTPKLDGFMRSEISTQAKAFDSQLARIQSFVLDAIAPLTSIVEANAKGEKVDHKQAVNAATAALELVGNASAQISHYRRSKIVTSLNKTLLLLVEEDKNFEEAPPSLFGTEFARKSKELIDQVKAMRSHMRDSKQPPNQFFRSVPPNSRGVDTTQDREEAIPPEGETTRGQWVGVPNNRNPSGTSKLNAHRQFHRHDNNSETYAEKSYCMPGHRMPSNFDPAPGRETGGSPAELAGHYSGPVGPRGNSGLSDRLLIHTTPSFNTKSPHMSTEQLRLVKEEVADLIQKGAIEEINPSEGFYSNLFLVPKKDGGQRPVINLKALNQFVQKQHFKMEGIHNLKDLLKPGDWLAKVDLKDAFFTIPIHHHHRKYLRFMFQQRAYQFTCLPFGLCSAPWVFTKVLKPALALLRQEGVRLIAYIDDILVLAESKEMVVNHLTGIVYLLENLGFIINQKKSVLTPAQTIEFLGLTVDSLAMELRLPLIKIKQIRAEARKIAQAKTTSARALAHLLGMMNATNNVIPPAPLFCRQLQMTLSNTLEMNSQCYEALITLTQGCLEELNWWNNNMCKWNGKTLMRREVDLTIDSDASLEGWGAHCNQERTGGPWSAQERTMHINCLEPLAATLAVQTFAKARVGISILLRIDNTTAVAYINHLGGTVSKELVILTKDLWMWCLERNIHITAQHLPGAQNTIADAESRSSVDRTDWKLNPAIFQRIAQLFGPLEIDLFATRLTSQCHHYFSWRPDPYAIATDAFLQTWTGLKGYANPPWNLIGRVLAQVQRQQARVVLVAPVWRGQPWFPVILRMLVDYPRRMPTGIELTFNLNPTLTMPHLAVWHISGIDTETKSFQMMLQLNSWRAKTNKSYDSLFRKWHSWCSQRNFDPFSGPIANVVNFLAHLYKDGYQYSSVNAYRSSISSVHEKVDWPTPLGNKASQGHIPLQASIASLYKYVGRSDRLELFRNLRRQPQDVPKTTVI